jgi:creatinine amidohydrolase
MTRNLLIFIFTILCISVSAQLPVKWEELSSSEFVTAVEKAGKVCVVPMGVIEKHGPYLPLATDLLRARDVAYEAAKKEYVVVYPEFYFGQINEARHQPGVIAYSPELVMKVLEETCDEIARNGFEKIILLNSHGGNNGMLSFYSMALLNKRHDYTVYFAYVTDLFADTIRQKQVMEGYDKLPKGTMGHAGSDEASHILSLRPDLYKADCKAESGEDLNRLKNLTLVTTSVNWYSMFPNQYGGDASFANKDLGDLMRKTFTDGFVKALKEVKSDTIAPALLKKFYDDSEHPLKTKQGTK